MGQCLKCGKKTDDKAVFCSDCRAIMDQYPVKPGTVAHIPNRPAVASTKTKPSNPTAVLNELIGRQRTLIRWLVSVTALLSVLLLATAAMLIQTLKTEQPSRPTIGKNYTTSQQP